MATFGALVFVSLASTFVRASQVVVDDDVSRWVVDSVPSAVEWVARLATWLGGLVGTAAVAGLARLILFRAGRRSDALSSCCRWSGSRFWSRR